MIDLEYLEQYYDEYEDLYDDKPVKRTKFKSQEGNFSKKKKAKNFKKPSKSKQELWDEYEENEEDFGKELMKEIKKEEKPKPVEKSSVRIIRGNSIDYKNVASIEQIEKMYNGNKTFGIKYSFRNKDNGAFKIVWFSQNQEECVRVFTREFKIWENLNK